MLWLTDRERWTLLGLGCAALLGAGLNGYRAHAERVTVQVVPADERAQWDRALDTARGLSVNTATAAQLERLPGIGPTLATRIVAYREAHGPFTSLRDLDRIEGVGPSLLGRLREYLSL